ncbi:MAG: DUF72 domain-containing protein [Chitinophagaceae bacterium]
MAKGKIHIGTSGWHYKHWKGAFYPADIKDKEQFAFYSKKFMTVELNTPFYHLPLVTIGPILFQLPPSWKINTDRLKRFLSLLPKKYIYTFEFRNHDWYKEEIYDLLKKFNCAFCIYELAGHMSPIEITADFMYVRLHGPTQNKYEGSYSTAQLKSWARRCQKWQQAGKDVYVYFDNDQAGYAAFNAQKLLELLRKK